MLRKGATKGVAGLEAVKGTEARYTDLMQVISGSVGHVHISLRNMWTPVTGNVAKPPWGHTARTRKYTFMDLTELIKLMWVSFTFRERAIGA